MSATRTRQAREKAGRRAETLAMAFLIAKLYRPIARRVRTPLGEIDLIVKKGDTLVFVEVKQRASLDQAAAAISPVQWQRIARAARSYLAANPQQAHLTLRFDAVLLAPGHWPVHILNAHEAA